MLPQDRFSKIWSGYLPHGTGISVSATGNRYEGEWVDGMRDGEGFMFYNNTGGRDLYTGRWEKHNKHGSGFMEICAGEGWTRRCNGTWYRNRICGSAVISYPCGSSLTGIWGDHMLSGQGVLELPNGDKYTGEFHCEFLTGIGKVVYSNGDTFDGEFTHFATGRTTAGVGVDTFPYACTQGQCNCTLGSNKCNAWFERVAMLSGCMTEKDTGVEKHGLWTRPVHNDQGGWSRSMSYKPASVVKGK
eukprot:gene23033-29223_t